MSSTRKLVSGVSVPAYVRAMRLYVCIMRSNKKNQICSVVGRCRRRRRQSPKWQMQEGMMHKRTQNDDADARRDWGDDDASERRRLRVRCARLACTLHTLLGNGKFAQWKHAEHTRASTHYSLRKR